METERRLLGDIILWGKTGSHRSRTRCGPGDRSGLKRFDVAHASICSLVGAAAAQVTTLPISGMPGVGSTVRTGLRVDF